jgi:hypothetical protein
MHRNKLVVAGCSFSDFTRVDHPYGQILSEKLGYDYIHEGAGCGSNQRIWRRLTTKILDGEITENDLIVIQYTEKTRTEFYTSYPQDMAYKGPNCKEAIRVVDDYTDGHIIRFKIGADIWQYNQEEMDLFKLYEDGFLSLDYSKELFRVNNYNFQSMLARNNIKCIFIKSWRYPYNLDTQILPEFEPYVFYDLDIDRHHNLAEDDYGHLSQEGHKVLSEKLYTHIKKIGL